MRRGLWKQSVLLLVVLAIMATTSAWAAPDPAREPTFPGSEGIVMLWWNALTEWLGWGSWELDAGSERDPQTMTLGTELPELDPTVWISDPSADAGPTQDPDG